MNRPSDAAGVREWSPQSMMARSRPRDRQYRALEKLTVQRKESKLEDAVWRDFEKECLNVFGRDTGRAVFEGLRRAEHDYIFGATFLLGFERVLDWQVQVKEALDDRRYFVGRLSNSGGKTVDYMLDYALAGFFRFWAPDATGVYRMLHLAPEQTQAEQIKQKLDEVLDSNSILQRHRVRGGWTYNDCLLTPFIEAKKQDNDLHEGYEWMGGMSVLTMRSTAYKGKSSDGGDPDFVGWDEVRHEKNYTHVKNAIILARFLRKNWARFKILFTPLGASVELIADFEHAISEEQIDWHGMGLDLEEANITVTKETRDLINRNLDERYRPMVTGGKPIQPEGSLFDQASIAACIEGTKVPDNITDLFTVRARVIGACTFCQERKPHPRSGKREHGFGASMDPASSAAWDDTVCMAIDLDPMDFPKRWARIVYIEALPVGTKIQRRGAHLAIMSIVLRCPAAYDAKSALGHDIEDQLVDFYTLEDILASKHVEDVVKDKLRALNDDGLLAPRAEIVPRRWDHREDKDRDLSFLGALLDIEKLGMPAHLRLRSQVTNYERKDDNIPTDYVMCLVVMLWLVKLDMPDASTELNRKKKQTDPRHDPTYDGLGSGDVGAYMGIPDAGMGGFGTPGVPRSVIRFKEFR